MRKFLLVSAFLFVLSAVLVAAQGYDECYAKCKEGPYRDCIAKGMSEDECYKSVLQPCAAQCPRDEQKPEIKPIPLPVVRPVAIKPTPVELDCPVRCKMSFDECIKAGGTREECEKRVEVCMLEKCGIKPEPKLSCPEQCRADYGTCLKRGNDAEECKKKSEHCISGCYPEKPVPMDCIARCRSAAKGDVEAAKKCIQEHCEKPEPMDCIEKCKRAFGDDVEGAKKCIHERCEKPEPMDCVAKCRKEYGDDVEAAKKCIREHCKKPECPPPSKDSGCEMRCAHSYYGCAKKARELKGDEHKRALAHCGEGVAGCLDGCKPEMIPVPEPEKPGCEERCRKIGQECMAAGVDAESCKMKVKDCIERECKPKSADEKKEAGAPKPPTLKQGFWARFRKTFIK